MANFDLAKSNFFDASDFREILLKIFEQRKIKRQAYSIRAFARDLGMNMTTLSGVLKGRYGISRKTAAEVVQALKFSADQSAFFLDLVDSKHGRTKLERNQIQMKLPTL